MDTVRRDQRSRLLIILVLLWVALGGIFGAGCARGADKIPPPKKPYVEDGKKQKEKIRVLPPVVWTVTLWNGEECYVVYMQVDERDVVHIDCHTPDPENIPTPNMAPPGPKYPADQPGRVET